MNTGATIRIKSEFRAPKSFRARKHKFGTILTFGIGVIWLIDTQNDARMALASVGAFLMSAYLWRGHFKVVELKRSKQYVDISSDGITCFIGRRSTSFSWAEISQLYLSDGDYGSMIRIYAKPPLVRPMRGDLRAGESKNAVYPGYILNRSLPIAIYGLCDVEKLVSFVEKLPNDDVELIQL